MADRAGDIEIHQVEERIFRYLLTPGRLLLEVFTASVGTGRDSDRVASEEGEELWYLRDNTRQYFSIFGKVLIPRAYYFKVGKGGVHPLDGRLNLPEQGYSYLLQKWMAATGVRQNYESAVKWIEDFLGLKIPHRGLQRMTSHMSQAANEFWEYRIQREKERRYPNCTYVPQNDSPEGHIKNAA